MADSEYLKRQDGNGTVFEVTPATAAKNKFAMIMAAICCVIGLLFFFNSSPFIGLFLFCSCGLFLWIATKDWRPKPHQRKATFRVTPSAIETNGRTFNKEEIHRLIVRNGVTDLVENTGFKAGRSRDGLAGGAAISSHQQMKKLSKIAHSLELEAGGKAYTLAAGIDEPTAFGLLKDVRNVIGVETWS
jgi:hypothetical protein